MDEKQTITAEQAADLAAIQSAIMEQSAAPGMTGSPGEPPRADLAVEFTGMMKLAVAALSPAFPSLTEIYTDQVTAAAASAAAAVCNKHGWLQGGIGGKWAEEIACAAILLPLAYQTYQGVTSDLAKAAAKKPTTEPASIANDQGASAPVATDTFINAVDAEPVPA